MAHPHWPLFDLRIRTPRLELRLPSDGDAVALAELAASGVHPPEFMPFSIAWTDVPPPQQQRNTLQHTWSLRANWQPEDWHAGFAVLCDGELVGTQGLTGRQFASRRTVSTGSWVALGHQGRGIGKEMRAAVLHLAFAGLGADRAESGAWKDNRASFAVSRSLGYVENGDEIMLRRGVRDRQIRLLLTRERWEARRRDDITFENLEPCLPMFGAGPAPA